MWNYGAVKELTVRCFVIRLTRIIRSRNSASWHRRGVAQARRCWSGPTPTDRIAPTGHRQRPVSTTSTSPSTDVPWRKFTRWPLIPFYFAPKFDAMRELILAEFWNYQPLCHGITGWSIIYARLEWCYFTLRAFQSWALLHPEMTCSLMNWLWLIGLVYLYIYLFILSLCVCVCVCVCMCLCLCLCLCLYADEMVLCGAGGGEGATSGSAPAEPQRNGAK